LSGSLHVPRHGLKAVPPPLLPEPDKPAPGLHRDERARGQGLREGSQGSVQFTTQRCATRFVELTIARPSTPQVQDGFVRLRK
jgi:hypothetical protein